MNNNYTFFTYAPGNSKVHNMNSKNKILYLLLSFLIICLINDNISLILYLALTFSYAICTMIDLKYYLNNILKPWPLYIIIFTISLALTFNLYISAFLVIKIILIIFNLLILTFTTSLSEIAWGIECLLGKLKKIKVPVSKIALTVAMWFKFISTSFEQYSNIRKSMAYRGIPYKKNHSKVLKNITLPVVILSYKLSKRMTAAMKLRFYGYLNKRTNYHENKTTSFDKIMIVLECIIIYISIWLGWYR